MRYRLTSTDISDGSPDFTTGEIFPHLNPPRRRLYCNGKSAVIPAKAGIQVIEIIGIYKLLDARLRGHDELRQSLPGGRRFEETPNSFPRATRNL